MDDKWLAEMRNWCEANPEAPVPAKFFLYLAKEIAELTDIVKESEHQLVEARELIRGLEGRIDEVRDNASAAIRMSNMLY